MNDRFASEVRLAFDARYVPSPGLEARVLERLHEEAPRARHPRLAAGVAALLGVAVVVPLAWLAIGAQLVGLIPAFAPQSPALSLGAVTADGQAWVVERDITEAPPNPTRNVLFQGDASGWHERLRFNGIYLGMRAAGAYTLIWTMDQPQAARGTIVQPERTVHVYQSADGGHSWAQTPIPAFTTAIPVAVFFDGPRTGWAIAPQTAGPLPRDLYQTTDAGATWSKVGALPAIQPPLGTRSFVPGPSSLHIDVASGRGWMTSGYVATDANSGLWVTADGGRTWSEAALTRPAAMTGYDLTVLEPHQFGGVDVVPVTFRRTGGSDNATANILYVYEGADLSHLGVGRPLFPSTTRVQPVGEEVSLALLDRQHWWVTTQSPTAGDSVQAEPALAATADAGAHWSVFEPAPRILFMAFRDSRSGYALAVEGPRNTNRILATRDGGAHWQHVTLPAFPAG